MRRRENLEFWTRLVEECGVPVSVAVEEDDRGQFVDLAGQAVRRAVVSALVRRDAAEIER